MRKKGECKMEYNINVIGKTKLFLKKILKKNGYRIK